MWRFTCLGFSCQNIFGHVRMSTDGKHIWSHQYYLWLMILIFISKLIIQIERDGSILWWHKEELCMEGLPSRGAGPSQALILRNIGSSTQGPRNIRSSSILAMAYTKAGHNHRHGLWTNVSYWCSPLGQSYGTLCAEYANIKSRHVQSWGRAGLVGWAGYTSPVQGQVGKCQHYRAQSCAGSPARPAMPQPSLPPAKLSALQRAADIWRVYSTKLIKSCFTQQLQPLLSQVWDKLASQKTTRALSLLSRTWNVKNGPK